MNTGRQISKFMQAVEFHKEIYPVLSSIVLHLNLNSNKTFRITVKKLQLDNIVLTVLFF